ncbi:MAG: hypothetical protein KGO50_09235, partial [Myxococcales bacterium]|nr:hypothetical protein [Myxococcales bacterium]
VVSNTPDSLKFCVTFSLPIVQADERYLYVRVPAALFLRDGKYMPEARIDGHAGTSMTLRLAENRAQAAPRPAITQQVLQSQSAAHVQVRRNTVPPKKKSPGISRPTDKFNGSAIFLGLISLPVGIFFPPVLVFTVICLARGFSPIVSPIFRGAGYVGSATAGAVANMTVSASAAVAREHDRTHGTSIAQRIESKRVTVHRIAAAAGGIAGRVGAAVAAGHIVGEISDSVGSSAASDAMIGGSLAHSTIDPSFSSSVPQIGFPGEAVTSQATHHAGLVSSEPALTTVAGYVRSTPDGIVQNNLSYSGPDALPANPPTVDVAAHIRTAPDGITLNNLSATRPI